MTRSLSTFIVILHHYIIPGQVDIIKGEAERQRLQREDLELELHALKDQMQSVGNADADTKRFRPFIPNYLHCVYVFFIIGI